MRRWWKRFPPSASSTEALEKLVEKKEFTEYVYVAERICGICSFMHGMGYCEAVEHIMNIEIPPRARYLRTIWCEMSRIHSHLLWLGLLADAFGFESLFMQSWRLREKVLDMFEASTGGRVIFSVNKIGGQRKDMDAAMLRQFVANFQDMEAELKELCGVFLSDAAVNTRLRGVGLLTKQQAHDLGAVGPFMRASGIALDNRKLGYAAYSDLNFEPVTSDVGDCYARCDVRIREIFQSHRPDPPGGLQNPRRRGGGSLQGLPGGRVFHAGGAAERRGRLLCEGQRNEVH